MTKIKKQNNNKIKLKDHFSFQENNINNNEKKN